MKNPSKNKALSQKGEGKYIRRDIHSGRLSEKGAAAKRILSQAEKVLSANKAYSLIGGNLHIAPRMVMNMGKIGHMLENNPEQLAAIVKRYPDIIRELEQAVTPAAAPSTEEYVDSYLFETGHFESREEYDELMRTAIIKPRARA
jgi:hypothetical protein